MSFASRLLLDMAAPAQLMKLCFDQCVYLRISFVAVETQTVSGIVDIFVMAGDTTDSLMGFVGERHR